MNNLSNVAAFIKVWDEKSSSFSNHNEYYKHSPLKNINYLGDCLSDAAITFTKNERLFYESIEDGIRSLVILLVEQFNWITFSSCSGHTGFKEHTYKKRMVQLLPRNEAEVRQIVNILKQAIEATHLILIRERNPIKIDVLEEDLVSDGINYSSIKLIFDGNNLPENIYFTYVDNATKRFCEQLSKD